jgi:transcription initiation factor TFIIE subunit alpha
MVSSLCTIIVSIFDDLDRRQWVKEEDLAKVLRLHPKQLRRTLRVLEEEMLVIREHRREVWLHFL